MDEILQLAVAHARVQDFFNFKLFVVFDDNRRRWILSTTGDLVVMNGLEKRHMENRMDSHRRGELETESSFADLVFDLEWPETLVIELVARASCLDVAS